MIRLGNQIGNLTNNLFHEKKMKDENSLWLFIYQRIL